MSIDINDRDLAGLGFEINRDYGDYQVWDHDDVRVVLYTEGEPEAIRLEVIAWYEGRVGVEQSRVVFTGSIPRAAIIGTLRAFQ